MARLRFVPQTREFFDLYSRASANAVEIARLLVALLDAFPEQDDGLVRQIEDREHDGDQLTHEIVLLLNRTFVTPFDRDDMYRLAGALDDVCDHVDEAADDVELFGVKVIPEQAKAQARVILSLRVGAARRGAAARGLPGLERAAGSAERARGRGRPHRPRCGRGPLPFGPGSDLDHPLEGHHERLEDAVDACQTAADVLEAILVKNR
jgi:uncharacterized protein Yka (UPF0111/DUF47 family)